MHEVLFDALSKDHRRFKTLLRRMLEPAGEGGIPKRQELVNDLTSELLPHMFGEEKGLYDMFRRNEESRTQALEGFEEHHVARIVLDELRIGSPQDESWEAKAKVLSDLIEHHIDEEEEELFERAEDVLSHEEAGASA